MIDEFSRIEEIKGQRARNVLTAVKSRRQMVAAALASCPNDYIHPTGARDDFQENWGGEDLDALSRYEGLQAVRITALGLTGTYQPPAGDKQALDLKVLPTLDVVVTGALSAGHRLLLSACAEYTADRVWTISAASLLDAINTGRQPKDFARRC